MNADDVKLALRRKYGLANPSADPALCEWACLDEIALRSNGWTSGYVDLLFVRAWSGAPKRHERHAVEVKVSRGDFLREIKPPKPNTKAERRRKWGEAKYGPMLDLAHRAYYAAPEGVIKPDELPAHFGLYEITGRGVRLTVQAPRRDVAPLPEGIVIAMLRRASTAEERIRRAADVDGEDEAAVIASLRARLKTADDALTRADAAVSRMRDRVADLRAMLTRLGEQPCSAPDCDRIVVYDTTGKWRHVDDPPGTRYGYGADDAYTHYPMPDVKADALAAAETEAADAAITLARRVTWEGAT